MLITLSEATEIATCHLDIVSGGNFKLIADATKEFDVGWVFYYQAARYLETGDISDSLAGNAPFFVTRTDARTFSVSYHRPLLESMEAYRKCGDPNAIEIPEVQLRGSQPGALILDAIITLRKHAKLGLADAKNLIGDCLSSRSPVISVATVYDARSLVNALNAVGFNAEVCYSA